MGNIQRARPVLPKAGRLLLYVFYRRHLRRKPKGSRRKGCALGVHSDASLQRPCTLGVSGMAFPEIPEEAVQWVQTHADGKGATNIWAPYIIPYKDKYRLYYCVSAFGRKTSYIGLAESNSPEGPWTQIGSIVKTNDSIVMNAIDPSVIADEITGNGGCTTVLSLVDSTAWN